MAEHWIRVRTPSDAFGGNVVIGRITWTDSGWLAWDDRHGAKRVSLHEDGDAAVAAVRLRASMSDEELDRETAEIVDLLREVQRLKAELDNPTTTNRIAEILARANEIGRLWA